MKTPGRTAGYYLFRPSPGGIVALLRLANADSEIRRLMAWRDQADVSMGRQRARIVRILALIDKTRQTMTHARADAARVRHHRERMQAHEAAYEAAIAALQNDAALALASSDTLERKRCEVEDLRREVARHVSSVLLQRYTAALRSGGGLAVVGVKDRSCSGCHRGLPSELESALHDGHGMATCPHCTRLLYDAEWLERDFRPATMRPTTRDVR
jgi:hypothetical protein